MNKTAIFAIIVFFCMASVGYTLTVIYAPHCFGRTKADWTRVYEDLVSQNKTSKGYSYIMDSFCMASAVNDNVFRGEW